MKEHSQKLVQHRAEAEAVSQSETPPKDSRCPTRLKSFYATHCDQLRSRKFVHLSQCFKRNSLIGRENCEKKNQNKEPGVVNEN